MQGSLHKDRPKGYEDIKYIPVGDLFIADYKENGKATSKIFDSNFAEKLTGEVLEINTAKGYLRININGEYKYYNFKFEEKSADTLLTTNTLFLKRQNSKYGFVDKEGNEVVDFIYDDATEQNPSGYAAIKKNGLWGAIDSKGNVVIKPEYKLDNNKTITNKDFYLNYWNKKIFIRYKRKILFFIPSFIHIVL